MMSDRERQTFFGSLLLSDGLVNIFAYIEFPFTLSQHTSVQILLFLVSKVL